MGAKNIGSWQTPHFASAGMTRGLGFFVIPAKYFESSKYYPDLILKSYKRS